MPRNVRNFWLSGSTSDRDIQATGPVQADGEMHLQLFVRQDGQVGGPIRIDCTCTEDGTLRVQAAGEDGPVLLWEGKR